MVKFADKDTLPCYLVLENGDKMYFKMWTEALSYAVLNNLKDYQLQDEDGVRVTNPYTLYAGYRESDK